LFLSTIARTPFSYFMTIFLAENVLQMVSPGTHSHSKFINPSELTEFFSKDIPWISALYDGKPTLSEAEFRDVAYLPWRSEWALLPRGTPSSLQSNYIFWARKPSQEANQ
jgi:2-polyprenyl-6-hydroxyphenyl methylase/3-demethylubiquinone-9 3-methyltransferase